MNISNNQRYKSTEEKIEQAICSLLKFRNYDDISIKEICYEAGINRSSFYAHYLDINDLMIKTEQKLSQSIAKIFNPSVEWNEEIFVQLFKFLKQHEAFYRAYLSTSQQAFMEKSDFKNFIGVVRKNGKDSKFLQSERVYHMAFFAGGLKALAKSWMQTGCKETPEEMARILTNEYKINAKYFA